MLLLSQIPQGIISPIKTIVQTLGSLDPNSVSKYNFYDEFPLQIDLPRYGISIGIQDPPANEWIDFGVQIRCDRRFGLFPSFQAPAFSPFFDRSRVVFGTKVVQQKAYPVFNIQTLSATLLFLENFLSWIKADHPWLHLPDLDFGFKPLPSIQELENIYRYSLYRDGLSHFYENYAPALPTEAILSSIERIVGAGCVLELGSGRGLWAALLRARGICVLATDPAEVYSLPNIPREFTCVDSGTYIAEDDPLLRRADYLLLIHQDLKSGALGEILLNFIKYGGKKILIIEKRNSDILDPQPHQPPHFYQLIRNWFYVKEKIETTLSSGDQGNDVFIISTHSSTLIHPLTVLCPFPNWLSSVEAIDRA